MGSYRWSNTEWCPNGTICVDGENEDLDLNNTDGWPNLEFTFDYDNFTKSRKEVFKE